MSHRRPPLVRALQLNTAVLIVEIAAGIGSNQLQPDHGRRSQSFRRDRASAFGVGLQPESGAFR
jgi:hypothetical protein